MSQYIPQVLICLVRVNRKKLGIVSIAAVCPKPVSYTHLDVYKRQPLLHALEGAVPLPEQEPAFTVYDDIRQKLIAQGMPADQIAFIHEANTEVRKKELFSEVRTGQVR